MVGVSRAIPPRATVLGGVPAVNPWLLRRCGFAVGDPAAYLEIPLPGGGVETVFILREIEVDRARAAKVADATHGYGDFEPAGGLASDREVRIAQSAAECLRRRGVREAWADRSLPMVFAAVFADAGIVLRCDPMMGVLERRSKSDVEVKALRASQAVAEQCVRFACEWIAGCEAGRGGVLVRGGEAVSSERVRAEANLWLLRRGAEPCTGAIIAGGAQGGDCHEKGSGPLRTGEPIIVDVWPRDPATRYYGDCTRTVVHGREADIPPAVRTMHAAVAEAKHAAMGAASAGVTGGAVHAAACAVFRARGFAIGLPPEGSPDSYTGFVHGTGHGVGLDVHEPPLLDEGGPALVEGDCLTIEPGLYSRSIGGVRIEDMVIARRGECESLNSIPDALTWA